MSTTYDPINLLRDYTLTNKRIDVSSNTHIFFGNVKVSLQHLTAWRRKSDGSPYNIGSLWLFLKHMRDNAFNMMAYMNDVRKFKVDSVNKIDQSEIMEYFTGVKDTTDAIDEDKRTSTMIERVKAEEEHKVAVREVLERPLSTKESILQSNVSFKGLLVTCRPYVEAQSRPGGPKRSRTTSSQSLIEEILSTRNHTPEYKTRPIIIVPSLPLAGNLCIHTCHDFLQGGVYIDPTLRSGQQVQQPVLIDKQLRHVSVTFEIFDQVIGFNDSHWRRLVGVFCQGSQYQFKEWSEQGNVKSILTKHRGYFLKYHDTPLEDYVKKLNVKVLEVQRNKRHFDKTAHNEFWQDMERFLFSSRTK